MHHALQKANRQTFYAKQKIKLTSFYLWKTNNSCQTCPITCYVVDTWLLQTLFIGISVDRYELSLTVLIKLIFNISKKFSHYLQIPGYSLYLITTIIDIIIFTKVDNKVLDFIIQFFFFNHVIGIIYLIFKFTQFLVDKFSLHIFRIEFTIFDGRLV